VLLHDATLRAKGPRRNKPNRMNIIFYLNNGVDIHRFTAFFSLYSFYEWLGFRQYVI